MKGFTIAFFKSTGLSPKLQFTVDVILGFEKSAHSIICHVGSTSNEHVLEDKFLMILFTYASEQAQNIKSVVVSPCLISFNDGVTVSIMSSSSLIFLILSVK